MRVRPEEARSGQGSRTEPVVILEPVHVPITAEEERPVIEALAPTAGSDVSQGAADLSRLARIGWRRSYAAGDAMVEKDSDRGGLFVILSGAAEVEAGGAVHTLGPGDFFGEMALLARSRRTATVLATEPVEAMVFETMHRRAFLIENPSMAMNLLECARENEASRSRTLDSQAHCVTCVTGSSRVTLDGAEAPRAGSPTMSKG